MNNCFELLAVALSLPGLLFLTSESREGGCHAGSVEVRESEVEKLVKQLGSDKRSDRENAEARLYTIGKSALDALGRAARSDDADVRRRAEELIVAITDRLSRKITVYSAAFSQDGSRAFIGSTEMAPAVIWLRDLKKAEDMIYLRGHPTRIGKLALSKDGRRGLVPTFQPGTQPCERGRTDYTVDLWDLAAGKVIMRLEGHNICVYSADFSPDERRALSCSTDRTVRLWDLEAGKEIRRMQGHRSNVFDVVFSPDGKRALSGGMDNTMRLWDLETGQELREMKHKNHVN